jgi:hypothetical protein
MPNQRISLSVAALAVIAAASLSLPLTSVAYADQKPEGPVAAKVPSKKPKHSGVAHKDAAAHKDLFGWHGWPQPAGCVWPYQNQFPPCMSTWPQGDPNYHGGSHPGVTFE